MEARTGRAGGQGSDGRLFAQAPMRSRTSVPVACDCWDEASPVGRQISPRTLPVSQVVGQPDRQGPAPSSHATGTEPIFTVRLIRLLDSPAVRRVLRFTLAYAYGVVLGTQHRERERRPAGPPYLGCTPKQVDFYVSRSPHQLLPTSQAVERLLDHAGGDGGD